LAVPRTGSSHVNALLQNCPQFIAKFELFHPTSSPKLSGRELDALRVRSGGAVRDVESFVAWRRSHPAATLEAMLASTARDVVFKVFPGQVPWPLLTSEILSRGDVAFAILKRRPIESFISGLKAKEVKIYSKVDTTGIRPALSAKVFVDWAQRTRDWYARTRDELRARGIDYARISYERHIEGRTDKDALGEILKLLAPLGWADIPLPAATQGRNRQDQTARYQDRVANWDAFAEEMQSDRKLQRLLRWAEKAPWTIP
jgi:hypothetical protein